MRLTRHHSVHPLHTHKKALCLTLLFHRWQKWLHEPTWLSVRRECGPVFVCKLHCALQLGPHLSWVTNQNVLTTLRVCPLDDDIVTSKAVKVVDVADGSQCRVWDSHLSCYSCKTWCLQKFLAFQEIDRMWPNRHNLRKVHHSTQVCLQVLGCEPIILCRIPGGDSA
jgi:hypothetical protein